MKRVHDPLQTKVQNVLGSYDEVKGHITEKSARGTELIGVVPQPSTPVTTKVKGGNPFAGLVKKETNSSPSLPSGRQDKKSVVNGQHRSKHHTKTGQIDVKRESASKSAASVGQRRTGVFEQFQNWENVDSKSKESSGGASSSSHKEREDRKKSSERKESKSHSRERMKPKTETKHEAKVASVKNESQNSGKNTASSDHKLNGTSSDASTPSSQKSAASSGYGSLKATNKSPKREQRDSDASLKSTPSPDAPLFQSPPSRVSNTGKPVATVSPMKSSMKLPNGVRKETSDDSKHSGLKLQMPKEVSTDSYSTVVKQIATTPHMKAILLLR